MSSSMMFDKSEFLDRYARLQSHMKSKQIDLLLINQPEMLFYLVGYAMSEGFQQFCIIPQVGGPVMILRTVDAGTCKEYSWIDDIVGYRDWDDPLELVVDIVEKKTFGKTKIGIDETSYSLTVQRYKAMCNAFPDSKFTDVSAYLRVARAHKSRKEIVYLRKAAGIADQAMSTVLERLQSGMSARECVAVAAEQIIRLGGDPSVIGPVTRSIDDSKMHALLDDDPLVENDLLHVELIPQYQGYGARMMRPMHIGCPSPELVDISETIVAIQDLQFADMRPGVPACEVDAIVREGMLNRGLKSSYTNISGYSLGYYQLFTCQSSDFTYVFRPTDKWVLEEGMVFHMYTVARGLAFSETILITAVGAERLTKTDRRLLST